MPDYEEHMKNIHKAVSEMSLEELIAHDQKSCAKRQELTSTTPTDLTPFPTLEEEIELYEKNGISERIQALINVEESSKKFQEDVKKAISSLTVNKDEVLESIEGYDAQDLELIDSLYSSMSQTELEAHLASMSKYLK
jgi:hypothetical protein